MEEVKVGRDTRNVYFLSLVGTNAGVNGGEGIPRSAHYIYDVKSRMELKRHGIHFLSAQDLKSFHDENFCSLYEIYETYETSILNIYELVLYFMEHHYDGYYFLDELPLIKGGMKHHRLLYLKLLFILVIIQF